MVLKNHVATQLVHWMPFQGRKKEVGGGEKGSEVIVMEAFEAEFEALIPCLGCSCDQSLALSYTQCQKPQSDQKPHSTQPSLWNKSMPRPSAGFPPRRPSYPWNPCVETGMFPFKEKGWQHAKNIDTAVV